MKNNNLTFFIVAFIFFALTLAIFLKRPSVNPLEPQNTHMPPQQSENRTYPAKLATADDKKTEAVSRKVADVVQHQEAKNNFAALVQHKKETTQLNIITRKPNDLIKHPFFESSQWQIWPQVTAKNSRLPLASDEQLVGKLNNYQLIKTDFPVSTIENFNPALPVILYDERMKRPGILTGTLIAVADNRYDLEKCAHAHLASVNNAFENINTYFLSSDLPSFNLSVLKNEIENCPSVRSVQLEIIDRAYEKK